MGYIYKITNDINNKIYIGKTEYVDPLKRWKEHLSDYKKDRNEHRPLYSAMKKYGTEHFYFEIIEKTNTTDQTSIREKYWIEKLRTYVGFDDCNGYNATLGGDGKCYLNLNEENVIQTYINNQKNMAVTARLFGVDPKTIKEILIKNNIKINSYMDTLRQKQNIKVAALDKITLKIIKTFDSITDANIFFGKDKNNGNIRCALKNPNKTAYGYKWIFI